MGSPVHARLEHILPTIHVFHVNKIVAGVMLTDVSNAKMDSSSKINSV